MGHARSGRDPSPRLTIDRAAAGFDFRHAAARNFVLPGVPPLRQTAARRCLPNPAPDGHTEAAGRSPESAGDVRDALTKVPDVKKPHR